MDLQDQLKKLFPDYIADVSESETIKTPDIWMQDDPIVCKYEIMINPVL